MVKHSFTVSEKETELFVTVRESIEEFLSSLDDEFDLLILSQEVKNLIILYGTFSSTKNNSIRKLYDKIQDINEKEWCFARETKGGG